MARKSNNEMEPEVDFHNDKPATVSPTEYQPGDKVEIPGLGNCRVARRIDGRLEVYRESEEGKRIKNTFIVDIP